MTILESRGAQEKLCRAEPGRADESVCAYTGRVYAYSFVNR
jgi:hypothetical protein